LATLSHTFREELRFVTLPNISSIRLTDDAPFFAFGFSIESIERMLIGDEGMAHWCQLKLKSRGSWGSWGSNVETCHGTM